MHVVWGWLHSKLHLFAVIAATMWYYMKGKTKQQTLPLEGLFKLLDFFSHTSHLTKPNDMGHIASKYGNGMAWPMAQLWVMFWLCRGCCFPYQTHMCHKLHLFVGSIVFHYGTATYLAALHTSPIVSTMIWYGNSPNHSHIVQGYWYLIWECCVPFKLPYNLITRLPGRLTSDMGMA